MSAQASNRRWFRFSLRTLFVVITVVGGWIGYQLHWIQQRHDVYPWLETNMLGQVDLSVSDAPAPWSLRIFGEPGHNFLVLKWLSKPGEIEIEPTEWERLVAEDHRRLAVVKRLFPETQVSHNIGGASMCPPVTTTTILGHYRGPGRLTPAALSCYIGRFRI